MKKITKTFLLLASLTAAAPFVNAASLSLNDGNSVDGEWVSIKSDTIEVNTNSGHVEVALTDLSADSRSAVDAWAAENPAKVNLYKKAEVAPSPIKSAAPTNDGIAGMVAVLVTIDEKGQVLEAEIKKSTDERLNNRSISAVKKWRFKPAEVNGEKVKTQVVIPFRYS